MAPRHSKILRNIIKLCLNNLIALCTALNHLYVPVLRQMLTISPADISGHVALEKKPLGGRLT